jgi:putative PIN family toxin of toxin-antitoxin system
MPLEPPSAAGLLMSDSSRDKLIYDCNVFLQYLLNRNGPSGRCVNLALEGSVELFVSDAVLDELRELPEKPFCISMGITGAVVAEFITELLPRVIYVEDVPDVFVHPIDPDDSAYVNLAIATGAELIVSRDNHLLNLTKHDKPWSAEFRARFPRIRILQPHQYLADWDKKHRPGG